MSTPDIAGEVIAYRAWRVEQSWRTVRLLSMNNTVWPADRWLIAECPRSCGATPGERCTCGIYAALDRRQLVGLGYNESFGSTVAVGEVGLVGKVIPGSQGWRAAKGRIVRLWLPHVHWRLCRPLADTYGVPVALSNTLLEADRGHR